MTRTRFSRTIALAAAAAAFAGCARPAVPPASAGAIPHPASSNIAPNTPLTASQRAWVDSTLATLDLRHRVAQMVFVWALGDYANSGEASFLELRKWIERDGVGGVSMSLGTPIEVGDKINAMQRMAKVPLLFSIDLEPGLGRLEGGVFTHYLLDAGSAAVFPSNMAIAATGRDEDAYAVGKAIGEEARAVGIQIDFAPTVDVNNNPNNPVINTRSFGEDPRRVARLSELFVRGLQDAGVAATAKHFPGHGDTDVDSHVGLPVVGATRARLDSVELIPFRAAIDAGVALVMTAHIALPAVNGDSSTPATLAPAIVTSLLRDSLGFRGVAITDAMTMEGVGKGYTPEESSVLAIEAGAEVLLKPSDPTRAIDAVVAAVERGDIPRARIDSAARHILELKARTGVAFAPISSLQHLRDVVGSPDHRALAADVAQRAITLLRDRDGLVPMKPAAGERLLVVQYMPETELRAGKVFGGTLRGSVGGRSARVVKISPTVSPAVLDSLSRAADEADRVVVAAYVRRIEGEGRVAVPTYIASWIDSLVTRRQASVVAFGNPYLLRQFPNAGTYLVTYGVSDDLERAAARALLGMAPISGRAPISLPGYYSAGDGIQRPASAAR